MTVFTKPSMSALIRKALPPPSDTSSILDVHENEMNENEMREVVIEGKKPVPFCFVVFVAMLVGLAGLLCGLEVYRQSMDINQNSLQYRGFCEVPLQAREQLIEPYYRMSPLEWRSAGVADVLSYPVDKEALMAAVERTDTLVEQFAVGEDVESIMVFNGPNGRPTNFVHDFAMNMSGIVDDERCFLMELNPEVVLPPRALLLSIRSNQPFDISHVRSTLRAVLPPVLDLLRVSREIRASCGGRPIYQLRDDYSIIRKRSTEPAQVDYKFFSGKQVQEIEIGNLQELLAHEGKK